MKRNAIVGALGAIAALAMFAAPATAAAATDVPVTTSTFPDPVLRTYVKGHFDTNDDSALSTSEIAAATEISMRRDVSDPGALKVHSAQGIQYLADLQSLDLYSNALTSIDLTHNTKLRHVTLCNNKFTEAVDLTHNTELVGFTANYANLPSIDLSKNTKLEQVQLDGNQFASLDLSHNTKLTKAYVNWNPMVALRTAPGQKIDFLSAEAGGAVTSIDGRDHYDRGYQANDLVGGTFDLKKAVPWIDASRISDVKGATLNGTTLTNVTATDVTYQYAVGDAAGAKLTAHVQFVSVPEPDVKVPQSVDTVSLTTTAGRAPAFPSEVTVHYTDGTTQQRSVKWNDSTDWTTRKLLPQPVVITGDVDGVALKAFANVTIKSPFTDVNDLTPHATDIYWLSGQDITQGYEDGSFGGMRDVTRQDMAAFLYRLAGRPPYTPSAEDKARFKDVNPSTPHYEEVLWLGHAGIAQGYEDGTFGGMRTVVRQDMAAFLRRLAIYEGVQSAKDYAGPSADTRNRYVDVSGSPHEQDVWWLIDSGVAEGYPDHTFGGSRTVVRQDMAAFLHRMKTEVLK